MATHAHSDEQKPLVLTEFDEPFLFTYGSWEKRATTADGHALLRGEGLTNAGGGGVNRQVDLSPYSDYSPVLVLRVGQANQAKGMRLLLLDKDHRQGLWTYELPPAGESFQEIVPLDGASLGESVNPEEPADKLDPATIIQWQIQGDWAGNVPLDVTVERIVLVAPNADILAARQAKEQRDAESALQLQRTRLEARESIRHDERSPEVVHICAVDHNLLAITIVAGELQRQDYQLYQPQPDDEILEQDALVWAVQQGEIVQTPEKRILRRQIDGRRVEVGLIAGGRVGPLYLWPYEQIDGDSLENRTADDCDSYRIMSVDDPEFAQPLAPSRVYRKSKPTNRAYPQDGQVVRHTIYLELPHALREGKAYTIKFPYVNTRQPSVSYLHDCQAARSEAIHTQQIGYRPDDPYKRAFLSLWLGTGGAHTYEHIERFQLLDSQDKIVFEEKTRLVLPIDGKEQMRPAKNFSQTAVWALDFSSFRRPGTYRVHIPGIGCSYPVMIGDDTWNAAFRLSMHGFLTQRSGLELGPPFTSFRRPRDLHPEDGCQVYRSSTSLEEAFADGDWFEPLVTGRTAQTLPGAWGGYHDAGDYDRAANHLWATYQHLELLDLFPAYFGTLELALPPDETGDALPDILNEALWNLDLFRRLQDEDGGVSGGIESSAHPRPGEASHMDSLLLMAYAPDVSSSYTYAAVAARAARLLQNHDRKMAEVFRQSALRAWEWAERHREKSTGKGYQAFSVRDGRNVAAVELLWLTGQERFEQAFSQTTQIADDGYLIEQQGGAFAYVRLPDGLGDPAKKAQARKRLIEQADQALDYAEGNAFGLTVEIKDMPLIGPVGAFTTPGMVSQVLPRVHYLTGETRYLAGTVRACNFSAGANPDNMTFTSGVGFQSPHAPLHFDSRYTGQTTPAGVTVYGAYDAESLPSFAQGSDWVHTWFVGKTMIPNSRTWPATEGYVDFFLWPMMCEFTIKQNMGPTSYYWGYLAARNQVTTRQ